MKQKMKNKEIKLNAEGLAEITETTVLTVEPKLIQQNIDYYDSMIQKCDQEATKIANDRMNFMKSKNQWIEVKKKIDEEYKTQKIEEVKTTQSPKDKESQESSEPSKASNENKPEVKDQE